MNPSADRSLLTNGGQQFRLLSCFDSPPVSHLFGIRITAYYRRCEMISLAMCKYDELSSFLGAAFLMDRYPATTGSDVMPS